MLFKINYFLTLILITAVITVVKNASAEGKGEALNRRIRLLEEDFEATAVGHKSALKNLEEAANESERPLRAGTISGNIVNERIEPLVQQMERGYAEEREMMHKEPDEPCVSGAYPPKDRPTVPTYQINLDLPPEERWKQVATDKAKEIQNLILQLKSFLKIIGNMSVDIIAFIDDYMSRLADTFPAPFGDEIKGIAKAANTSLGEIVTYNIFYEIFTVCTSIVAHDSKGKMYHARNLDFGLFMGWNRTTHSWAISEALKPLIVNLEFYSKKKLVYKAASYGGYVGVITAMKPGVFTMSMDERFAIRGGFIGLINWLIGIRNEKFMSFLTREVMEQADSYEEARHTLMTVPLLAPGYYILGGNVTGQACVITRSRDKTIDVWNMTKDDWYLVETNYDHWEKPFVLDDRRTPAKKCLNKTGQKNIKFSTLFDVLSTRPVLNKLTTYTALMQVNSGSLETYLQYCPDPCIAW